MWELITPPATTDGPVPQSGQRGVLTWPQSEVQFLPGPLMGPFWETLDKIGIALGIIAILGEAITLFWVYQTKEDVEDIQEDVDDMQDEDEAR